MAISMSTRRGLQALAATALAAGTTGSAPAAPVNLALTLGTTASTDFGGYGPGYPIPGTVQIHVFTLQPGDSIPWH